MILERIKSMKVEEELKIHGNGKYVVLVYSGYRKRFTGFETFQIKKT